MVSARATIGPPVHALIPTQPAVRPRVTLAGGRVTLAGGRGLFTASQARPNLVGNGVAPAWRRSCVRPRWGRPASCRSGAVRLPALVQSGYPPWCSPVTGARTVCPHVTVRAAGPPCRPALTPPGPHPEAGASAGIGELCRGGRDIGRAGPARPAAGANASQRLFLSGQ